MYGDGALAVPSPISSLGIYQARRAFVRPRSAGRSKFPGKLFDLADPCFRASHLQASFSSEPGHFCVCSCRVGQCCTACLPAACADERVTMRTGHWAQGHRRLTCPALGRQTYLQASQARQGCQAPPPPLRLQASPRALSL